jgi:hypothetical protein
MVPPQRDCTLGRRSQHIGARDDFWPVSKPRHLVVPPRPGLGRGGPAGTRVPRWITCSYDAGSGLSSRRTWQRRCSPIRAWGQIAHITFRLETSAARAPRDRGKESPCPRRRPARGSRRSDRAPPKRDRPQARQPRRRRSDGARNARPRSSRRARRFSRLTTAPGLRGRPAPRSARSAEPSRTYRFASAACRPPGVTSSSS